MVAAEALSKRFQVDARPVPAVPRLAVDAEVVSVFRYVLRSS